MVLRAARARRAPLRSQHVADAVLRADIASRPGRRVTPHPRRVCCATRPRTPGTGCRTNSSVRGSISSAVHGSWISARIGPVRTPSMGPNWVDRRCHAAGCGDRTGVDRRQDRQVDGSLPSKPIGRVALVMFGIWLQGCARQPAQCAHRPLGNAAPSDGAEPANEHHSASCRIRASTFKLKSRGKSERRAAIANATGRSSWCANRFVDAARTRLRARPVPDRRRALLALRHGRHRGTR